MNIKFLNTFCEIKFLGRVTMDPQIINTSTTNPAGSTMLSLNVLYNTKIKMADGTWQDKPNFLRFIFSGDNRVNDNILKFVKIGDLVMITGTAKEYTREVEGKRLTTISLYGKELNILHSPRSIKTTVEKDKVGSVGNVQLRDDKNKEDWSLHNSLDFSDDDPDQFDWGYDDNI